MKKIKTWLIFISSFLMLNVWGADQLLDRTLAVVNDEVLTQSDFNEWLRLYHQELKNERLTEKKRGQLIEEWLDLILQLQQAQARGITLSTQELETIVTQIIKGNKLTPTEFEQVIREQEKLTLQDFKKRLETQVLLGRIRQVVLGRGITVTPEEIDTELKKVNQYQVIDLCFNEEVFQSQLSKIEPILNRLKTKLIQAKTLEALMAIAQAEKILVTDLGTGIIKDFPELFHPVLAKMQSGELSELIKADNGYHVLKVLSVESKAADSLLKQQVQEFLYQQKISKKLPNWIQELRKMSSIQVF